MSDHSDVVRASFARQATAFEDPSRHFSGAELAAWMSANTPVHGGDLVLEVAAGTALYGRAVARHASAVVAMDLTPEMLSPGMQAARAAGLSNMVFQVADAERLPFVDASFDVVISRLAVHHLEDPLVGVAEMARVCRPGGFVAVIDMVVLDEADERLFNELERRRDPSHVRALGRGALQDVVRRASLNVVHTSSWEHTLDGERWMAQTSTSPHDATAIHAAWDAELSAGVKTGMTPSRNDDRVELVHVWDLIAATR